MNVSFPAAMIAYQENLDCVVEPSPSSSWTEEEDPYVLPSWVVESSHSHDFLDDVFPSDEAIIEAMSGLSHLGKSCIIDHIFFSSLTIWSVRNLGRLLVRRLVVLWFH